MVGSVLGSTCLVGATEESNFFGNEFSGGSGGEVAVVGRVVAELLLVSGYCLRVFVSTEGFVYCLFPGEGEVTYVGEGVGWAPFGISMLS